MAYAMWEKKTLINIRLEWDDFHKHVNRITDYFLISHRKVLIFENYHLDVWALTPTNFHENRKTFNFSEHFHLSLEVFIVDEKEKKYCARSKNAWEWVLWPNFIFHDYLLITLLSVIGGCWYSRIIISICERSLPPIFMKIGKLLIFPKIFVSHSRSS
jgi:hypothetical protein